VWAWASTNRRRSRGSLTSGSLPDDFWTAAQS
jgi:hypothetical protein